MRKCILNGPPVDPLSLPLLVVLAAVISTVVASEAAAFIDWLQHVDNESP
jgi:hypothetical protein